MSLLSVLATVFGLGEGLFNIPQAYRIFKRKSAKDLSIFTYGFQIISVIVWLLYGIEIRDSPIIISNIFATITIAIVLVGWFIYGREIKVKRELTKLVKK
ncbi:MAG: SemiSWEET family transporter [archaeon]